METFGTLLFAAAQGFVIPHVERVMTGFCLLLFIASVFLPACIRMDTGWDRESEFCFSLFVYVCVWVCPPLSPHPPPVLSVQRRDHLEPVQEQSLGTSHTTPPLKEYSSVLYYTILYYAKRFRQSQQYQARQNYVVYYILTTYVCQFQNGKVHFCSSTGVQMSNQNIHSIFGPNLF